jgi:hypothetical protein
MNKAPIIYRLLNGDAQLSDEQHDAFLSKDRQLYAALLRLPNLSAETAMAIIQRLLAVTEMAAGQAVPESLRLQEDRLIVETLPHLPVDTVLAGFLKLVELRVNNQRTSGWIRAYIFGAPQLESWAVNHRRDLRILVRHALGNPVTLTCLHKFVIENPDAKTTAYLQRYVLRYAKNAALVRDVFLFLFGKLKQSQFSLLNAYLTARQDIQAGKGLPFKVLRGIAGTFHAKISQRRLQRLASRDKVKREVSEEIDESLVGSIRHYYRSGEQLNAQAIEQEMARIPYWDAFVYFIIDASASMRGFGTREYNSIAIATGIFKVFQKRIRQTAHAWVGGSDDENFPQPMGTTSIAPTLIEAFQHKPDVIIIISDGYENIEQGDKAAVFAGLEQLGIQIPIVQIIPAFTERDRIENRQLLPTCFLETGLRGFLSTWLRIRAHLAPDSIEALLRETLSEGSEK